MEWTCRASRIFLLSSFFFATSYGDFPTGATQAIRCILSKSVPEYCSTLPEIIVPSYLVSAYNSSPQPLHDALRSGYLNKLSIAQMASLPLSLLYLIPRGRLTDLNGTQLGAVIQKYADDTSLAHQVAASIHNRTQLVQLIHKLKDTNQEVLRILGHTINLSDLDENFFNVLPYPQEPIFAYLRPEVLFKLHLNILYKILLHLREAKLSNLPRREAIHLITQAGLRINYTLATHTIGWLLMGLTPDQLRDETILKDINLVRNFRLNFTNLQARAVFDHVYHNTTLNKTHVFDCKPLLTKLSPSLLIKFPIKEFNYDTLTKLPAPHSLPTACQIGEYVLANCRMTGKLPKEEEPWGIKVKYLEHWVYTLPLSALEEYIYSPLSTAHLRLLDSPKLSPLQAYYLTGRGQSLDVEAPNSVEELGAVLQALPASQLVNRKVGDISSVVLKHLAATLPGDNLPRTLALVHKIASSLDETPIMESLLENKDVNAIMSLVSPKDLQAAAFKMLKMFSQRREQDYRSKVRQLPQPVLAALLDRANQTTGWSWQSVLDSSQVSHLLVGALTCQHIEDMDTGLFIPIFSLYNRHRQQAFPKNLQQCSLRKLISHLQLKMTLSQVDPSDGLISLLEPIEIESVGGYVLVGLPVDAMKKSPYLGQILSTIGKLSNAELMIATNRSSVQAIAELAIDKEGKVDTFVARNLIWFLPPNTFVSELKLMLEAGMLDTTLCMPAADRRELAVKLTTAFGPTESWSGSVLATLQDLLLVFTDEELHTVSRAAWTEAADSLQSHYGDTVHWINSTAFYQVCANILGNNTLEEFEYISAVTTLVRWRLRAAQWQLNTVTHWSYTSPIFHPVGDEAMEQESKTSVPVFDPEVITELTGADEDDESTEDNKDSDIHEEGEDYEDESMTEKTTEKASTTTKTESVTTVKVSSTEKVTTMNELKFSTVVSVLTDSPFIATTKKATTTVQVAETTTSTPKPIDDTSFSSKRPITHLDIVNVEHPTTEKTITQNVSVTAEVGKKDTESTKGSESKYSTESSAKETTVPTSEEAIKPVTIQIFINESATKETTTAPNIPHNVQTNKAAEKDLHLSTQENKVTTVFPVNKLNSSVQHSSSSDSHVTVVTENADRDEQTTNIQPSPQEDKNVHTDDIDENFSTPKSNVNDGVNEEDNGNEEEEKNENSKTNLDNNDEDFNTINNAEKDYNNQSKNEEQEKKVETIEENNNEVYNDDITESKEIKYEDEKNEEHNTEDNNNVYNNDEDKMNENTNDEDKMEEDNNNVYNNDEDEMNENTNDEDKMEEDNNSEEVLYENIEEIKEDGKSIIAGELNEPNNRKKRNSDGSDQSEYNIELTCNALRMVGKISALALSNKDLENMSDEEVSECRVELGAMELSVQQKKKIWKRLEGKKMNGFHLLGNLLNVSNVADLWDLDFDVSKPWALETVHAFIQHSNQPDLVTRVMNAVQKANGNYSPELLAVLGNTVCTVESDYVRSLSVVGLAPWTHCPPCLPRLAQAAVEQLGQVAFWTQHHMHVLHGIVAGLALEDWKTLAASPYKPLSALQPSAVWCLNNSHLQVLSPGQIGQIPTLSLLSLSQQQKLALNETQLWALENATQLSVPEKLIPTKRTIYQANPTEVSAASYSFDDIKRFVVISLTVLAMIFICILNPKVLCDYYGCCRDNDPDY